MELGRNGTGKKRRRWRKLQKRRGTAGSRTIQWDKWNKV
jgi:hypothetical protein